MSSVHSHCQRWLSNRRNLMYHMASCPAKYNNNEDSLALLQHIPLKSSYDPHTSTIISVPCINDYTARLFEVDTNEIEGIWQIVLMTWESWEREISHRNWLCNFCPGTARIKPSIGRPKPVIDEASVSAATMTDFLKLIGVRRANQLRAQRGVYPSKYAWGVVCNTERIICWPAPWALVC